jgi:hypothetical protein
LSATITKKATLEKLPRLLPRAFVGLADGINLPEPITLLVFDDDPVHSRALDRELNRLKTGHASVVCAARDFTIEARRLAASSQVHILSLSNFGWSDERHENIKTLIRSKVKTPDWK